MLGLIFWGYSVLALLGLPKSLHCFGDFSAASGNAQRPLRLHLSMLGEATWCPGIKLKFAACSLTPVLFNYFLSCFLSLINSDRPNQKLVILYFRLSHQTFIVVFMKVKYVRKNCNLFNCLLHMLAFLTM